MKRRQIRIDKAQTINLNKRGSSVTTQVAPGVKVTTGTSGATLTSTTRTDGLSVTTQVRNGNVSMRFNRPRRPR